jgi:RNA polymerase sigma-70 factor (family 1)
VLDLDTGKEIVQDFFVHLYEIRSSVVITVSLESYLYQSVRNRCLNHIKQHQNQEKHLAQLQKEDESMEDIEADVERAELEHKIFRIIENLSPQCRRIFQLSRVQGLKNKEIAEQLNISKRTVETQISNALKALRSKLP